MQPMCRPQAAAAAVVAVLALFAPLSTAAERIVLAPSGLVAPPYSVSVEAAVGDGAPSRHIGWLTLGAPGHGLGLELEAEDVDLSRRRADISVQYSFTGNALVDMAPTLTCGVRDAFNTGRWRRAFYVALGKRLGLSLAQERFVRSFYLHAGIGTSRLEGPFLGFRANLAAGPSVSAEYVRRTVNASVSVPVVRGVEVRAYTLNGDLFWGARVSFAR